MARPLFLYRVKPTSWCIVVTENAGHFYFNTDTKQSVWQLDDTDIASDTLVANVNFDELGVLFARANGLPIKQLSKGTKSYVEESEEKDEERKELENMEVAYDDSSDMSDDEEEDANEHEMLQNILAESGLLQEESHDTDMEDDYRNESTEEKQQTGLALGYSSSDDSDGSEEHALDSESESSKKDILDEGESLEKKESPENEVSDEQEEPSEAVDEEESNNDLDLSLTDTTLSSKVIEDFRALLESSKDDISVYDPWFVVEEELLPKLAQNPVYYAVPEQSREEIFNQWVLERTSTEEKSAGIFPTAEMRFFHFLQPYKGEVRKRYFAEFLRDHSQELKNSDFGSLNLEDAYRRLRLTLNDFAEYERRVKKQGTAKSNVKVEHVQSYVAKHLRQHHCSEASDIFAPESLSRHGDFFEQWIYICNACQVPLKVANDPTNFIVGDEKRIACYIAVLKAKIA
ncbi:hypothetical protein A9F13_09g02530 [Clavispora lusitaniae]|uniref:WW domain-containing protein n=1 Tax=Clavispora lusitaniae TaxID=36911 RepID=A0AA91Q0F6_CLALS|nr:hypothetical protein A9F13_09g02530 [Clavispora lusitaniae]